MGSKTGLNRRDWLRCVPALAQGLWLPAFAQTRPAWRADPFALGVASGTPTPSGVVLWTRLHQPAELQEPISVCWEVAHDAQFQQIVQQGQTVALAALAHSVHVEVEGLAPDRWYHYRFLAGDAESPVGRTRTLPRPDADVARLRLAYASCQRWEQGYFSAYRHMLAEDVDLVLFLGDYIYEATSPNAVARAFTGGHLAAAQDLPSYRARYAAYKSDPDLQAMHAACPWWLTWDDHEVQNDYAGAQAGRGGPTVADFAARRAAAYQAYYEHQPLPSAALTRAVPGLAQGAEMRLYGAAAFGRLASVARLDARQYKDPQACTPGGALGSGTLDPTGCAIWHDAARSLLGTAQEKWLDAHLARAQAGGAQGRTWTVLGQQSLFGPRRLPHAEGTRFWNDGWDGYSAARTRLTQSLQASAAANPVLLGGDVHENWVGHVLADYVDPQSRAIGVEFCGTSLTSQGGQQARAQRVLRDNPHFVLADAERRGYGVAEFTPRRLKVQLRVLDDVRRADASISTLAAFEVEAGRSQLQRSA